MRATDWQWSIPDRKILGMLLDDPVDKGIFTYVMMTRAAKCKDQRDAIYSLPGLAEEGHGITPGYSKSVEQVYTEVAIQWIARRQSLGARGQC